MSKPIHPAIPIGVGLGVGAIVAYVAYKNLPQKLEITSGFSFGPGQSPYPLTVDITPYQTLASLMAGTVAGVATGMAIDCAGKAR